MNKLRSIIFNFYYSLGSIPVCTFLLLAMPVPRKYSVPFIAKVYGAFILWGARYIMGLKLEMRGLENLPKDTAFIISGKHQSAFETLTIPFMKVLGLPAIVHKKELYYIPLWGWFLWKMGQIGIDRGAGVQAMRKISTGAQTAIKEGRNLIIFPQGTRVKPGDKSVPYKVGLAKIYKDLNIPIVPMALNSGVFWPRNAFFKQPGTIVFEFLPAIPAGTPPLQAMAQMEEAIETTTDRLVAEAQSSLKKGA